MHTLYFLNTFSEILYKNGSYLIDFGLKSENKWVVDFFVQSKLSGKNPCLVLYRFFFPFVLRSILYANFSSGSRHFCEFRESLVVPKIPHRKPTQSPGEGCILFSNNLHLDPKNRSLPTNLFPVNRGTRSSQIKVELHYTVLTKNTICKIIHLQKFTKLGYMYQKF